MKEWLWYSPMLVVFIAMLLSTQVLAEEALDPEKTELQKVLSESLDDSEYVDTIRCLRSHEYTKVDIIDAGHVLFYGRKDRIWLNVLRHNCSGLRKGLALQFDMHGKRVCNLDFFKGITSFSDTHRPTAMCVLGNFEPVTLEQVALLKESLAKQKQTQVVRSTKKAAKASK